MGWDDSLLRLTVSGRHGEQWLVDLTGGDRADQRTLLIDENTSWLSDGHEYLIASALPRADALTSNDITFLWPGQGLYFAMDLQWNRLADDERVFVETVRRELIQSCGRDVLEDLYMRHCHFAVDTQAHDSSLAFLPITDLELDASTVARIGLGEQIIASPPVHLADGITAIHKPLLLLSRLIRGDFFDTKGLCEGP
jgi:hypothetical protein